MLEGFSVFTIEDARRAGAHLLERGPVRLKPVLAMGGRGQEVVERTSMNSWDDAEGREVVTVLSSVARSSLACDA